MNIFSARVSLDFSDCDAISLPLYTTKTTNANFFCQVCWIQLKLCVNADPEQQNERLRTGDLFAVRTTAQGFETFSAKFCRLS
ncbi:MAG: hypothetical protein ABSF34_12260, partial [Verrucomicrobiota bacterium]